MVVWISGASSGIGAALAASVPYEGARLIGISRRPPAHGEHVEADLANPGAWPRIAAPLRGRAGPSALRRGGLPPHVRRRDADRAGRRTRTPTPIRAAVLLNAASGQVLGKAFLDACRSSGTPATLVLCSSPAAAMPAYGASHYGAGKSALQYWAAAVATETEGWARVFSVVPYAVDTPMVRTTIAQPPGATPVAEHLRAAAERGDLATPEATAAQIWDLVLDDTTHGSAVPVGAVPAELRS